MEVRSRTQGGKLVIRKPWPSMLRGTIWGDPRATSRSIGARWKGSYFRRRRRRDKDGYFWIVGRIDDVLNVAGHRIGTAEVESALVSHQKVAEAAVVGRPDELKGQACGGLRDVKRACMPMPPCARNCACTSAKEIGPVAKPDDIRFAEMLPKTRSGKIMRRLLKQIASGTDRSKATPPRSRTHYSDVFRDFHFFSSFIRRFLWER
jgi:acetyl-CoA synthetase